MECAEAIPHLPPFAQELVDLIGFEPTMALVRAFGGIPLSIPKRVSGGANYEAIAELVGQEAADKLVARYGGDRVKMPRCHRLLVVERWRRIIADAERGDTLNQIALRYRITERAVSMILKKPVFLSSPYPQQASLF